KWGGKGPGDHPGHLLSAVGPVFRQSTVSHSTQRLREELTCTIEMPSSKRLLPATVHFAVCFARYPSRWSLAIPNTTSATRRPKRDSHTNQFNSGAAGPAVCGIAPCTGQLPSGSR